MTRNPELSELEQARRECERAKEHLRSCERRQDEANDAVSQAMTDRDHAVRLYRELLAREIEAL